MATLAQRLRQRLGVTSMFILSGLVGMLCGSGWGAPALAFDTIPPFFLFFPPPVQFMNNGQLEGTLQTHGKTSPITGTLDYLSENMQQQTKAQIVSVNPAKQQITSDSWVTSTPTDINAWEIESTDTTSCQMQVLSGDSYPQCAAWENPSPNDWTRDCTVTVQGNTTTFDIQAVLNGVQLVQLEDTLPVV